VDTRSGVGDNNSHDQDGGVFNGDNNYNGDYVSVKEPIKGRVALNPKTSSSDHQGQTWFFTKNPLTMRAIQTS
jgi:hypothetical protein